MKEKDCFNCQYNLLNEELFCPNCGQKVDDNNLGFKAVSQEFFENYLSLDTRIGRSILPFLFKPGKLVVEFIHGRRVSYVNPFRFYLIISIFFFFVLGVVVNRTVEEKGDSNLSEAIEIAESNKESSDLAQQLDELSALVDTLENIENALVQNEKDSLLKVKGLDETLSYSDDSVVVQPEKFIKMNSSGLGFNVNTNRLKRLDEYRYDKTYSDKSLLDSLATDSLGQTEEFLALQTIKLYRSDAKVITRFVLGNLSLGMLVLIPGLAFFLFLFYYKQRLPFVAHLLHSINLHTFFLFIYALGITLYYYFDYKSFIWLSFLLSAVYLFFSFKKVYPKGIFSTFWRFLSIGILYYFYWVLTITFGVIISFLLF